MPAIDLNAKQRSVLQVIRRNPEAANDDMALYELYWKEIDGWKPGDSMRQCTRPETISRRRRELAALGLVIPADEAIKRREEAFNHEKDRAAPGRAIPWMD